MSITAILAGWLALGLGLAAWSYRHPPRPSRWPIGFVVVVALWPFAVVGYAIEILEAVLTRSKTTEF